MYDTSKPRCGCVDQAGRRRSVPMGDSVDGTGNRCLTCGLQLPGTTARVPKRAKLRPAPRRTMVLG